MRVECVTGNETVTGLLPNEVFVKIGCSGCKGAGCGEFMVSETTRTERDALTEDLAMAQELSDLPMNITNNVGAVGYESQYGCSDDPLNCTGDPSGLFIEILTGTI